jgi:hypothetical protein
MMVQPAEGPSLGVAPARRRQGRGLQAAHENKQRQLWLAFGTLAGLSGSGPSPPQPPPAPSPAGTCRCRACSAKKVAWPGRRRSRKRRA